MKTKAKLEPKEAMGYSVQFINMEDENHLSGGYVDTDLTYGVRPAIWLNTAGTFKQYSEIELTGIIL